MKRTSGSWNRLCDAVAKSLMRVPTANTRSASSAMRAAALVPSTPWPPSDHSGAPRSAPLPAWVSLTGMPNPVATACSASHAAE